MIHSSTLAKVDFADLLQSRNAELPPVPDRWKCGLFGGLTGGDKPWGTAEDAVALLRGGKIAEGRELLRRLCKHTLDPIAKGVFAWELRRPPTDNRLSWSYLNQLPDPCSEFYSIKAMGMLSARDYEKGGECFLKAEEIRPASPYGCAMFLQSFLYFSDLYFQTRLLLPRKREIEGVIVATPMKGAAQLTLRQHEAAWETFWCGWIQSEEAAARYTETLKVTTTADEEKFIRNSMSDMCVIGMGLVLWDLGFCREAAGIFAPFSETCQGNCRHAAQVLAQAIYMSKKGHDEAVR